MRHQDFIDFFIDIKKIGVADLTLQGYRDCLTRYLPLNDDLRDFSVLKAQMVMRQMENLSAATQRRNLSILSQYYKYAVKFEAADRNFFEFVEKPRSVRLDTLKTGGYSKSELAEVFKAFSSLDSFWRLFFTLAVDTGCRRGELCGLRWDDVEWDKGILHIRRSVYKTTGEKIKIKEPKSKCARDIKIANTTFAELKNFRLISKLSSIRSGKAWTNENYIFHNGADEPINPSIATHKWHRFIKDFRLPQRRFHDLRHTSATLLLQEGLDVVSVSARLGHADLKTTMLYLHADGGEKAADCMEDIFASL